MTTHGALHVCLILVITLCGLVGHRFHDVGQVGDSVRADPGFQDMG